MEIEKKEKVKKILTRVWLGVTTFLSGLFVVAVAVGCSQKGNKQASAYYDESEYQYSYRYDYQKEYRKPQQAVVYNDEDYDITLSADEFNNYIWENYVNLIINDDLEEYFIYNNGTDIEFEGKTLDYISYYGSGPKYVYIVLNAETFNSEFSTNYRTYQLAYNEDDDFENLTGNIVIDLGDSAIYNDVKSAIQADIQANSVNPGTDFVNDIFTDMTEAVVGFTGSVGSGIVAMTALFYDSVNSQLTAVGLLSVIVVAVSLAYWLFRLIIGLIRMRG